MWAGVTPVPVRTWAGGEPSPGAAEVTGAEPSPGADVAPKTTISLLELFPVLPPWLWLIGCALDSGSTVTRAPWAAAHPLGTAHCFSSRPLT
jgi:hypothetical protein